jgi:hypothetical protein
LATLRIATGEIEETIPDDGKDPAAKALGPYKKAARTNFKLRHYPGDERPPFYYDPGKS